MAVVDDPTAIWRPLPGEPSRKSAYTLYFRKLDSLDYIFVADTMVYFHSFSCCCLPKCEFAPNSVTICICSSSRSSKVINFGTNGKPTYEFLLVINSNYGPILHRFRDTETYWLKIAYFSYPCLIWRDRSLCSLWNYAARFGMGKLESWGYPGASCMILVSTVFDWSTRVTDRQTSRQTSRRAITYTRYIAYMLSRAKT